MIILNNFKKNSSSLEVIKYLAIISMIIDHTAIIFYDENEIMRFIGRFAFIAFSYLLAYNYRFHSKHHEQYKKRLLIFALLSQVPYSMIFGVQLNIFFLLWFGLVMIDALEMIRTKDLVLYPTIIISTAIIVSWWEGYFLFGVFIIPLFYYVHDKKTVFYLLLLDILLLNFSIVYAIAGALSLLVIYYIHSDIKFPRINKYFFYLFYPVHLITLYALHEIL